MTSDEIMDFIKFKVEIDIGRFKNEVLRGFEHELSEMVIELTSERDDKRTDFTLMRVKRLQKRLAKLRSNDEFLQS